MLLFQEERGIDSLMEDNDLKIERETGISGFSESKDSTLFTHITVDIAALLYDFRSFYLHKM